MPATDSSVDCARFPRSCWLSWGRPGFRPPLRGVKFNAALPPLKEFILPGGSEAAAVAHTARAVCRRAERRLLTLSRDESVNDESRKYLNRLSDLLFVVARLLARENGGEIYWDPARNKARTA